MLFDIDQSHAVLRVLGRHLANDLVDVGVGAEAQCVEVARQAAATADPGERSFDDPAFRKNLEALGGIGALDDLDLPFARFGDGVGHPWSLIAAIGIDALDEGKAAAGFAQHGARAVAVLDVRGMDGDAQQQAERVDQNVALAALDLFARVVARRIERGPPFTAPLALWLSMMAAVGLASRPALSRVAT